MSAIDPSTADSAAADSAAADSAAADSAAADSAGGEVFAGELALPPRSAALTVLMTVTGVLLARSMIDGVGRLVLGLRRPATLRLSSRGLEISHRVELLGRVIRDRETLVPLDNLARVDREVRYARAGLYAGVAMLALGTYIGTTVFVDGLRLPSVAPSLLGLGAVIALFGIVADFVLSNFLDRSREHCRLVIDPHRGRRWCLDRVDAKEADRALARIAERAGYERAHDQ